MRCANLDKADITSSAERGSSNAWRRRSRSSAPAIPLPQGDHPMRRKDGDYACRTTQQIANLTLLQALVAFSGDLRGVGVRW
jgi:hypothetical protein